MSNWTNCKVQIKLNKKSFCSFSFDQLRKPLEVEIKLT